MRDDLASITHDMEAALQGMSLVGMGVDLVDVAWAKRLLAQHQDRLGKVFTETELAYCLAKVDPASCLAARMAAKEAVLKALGTGLVGGMAWHEIEIVRDDLTGKPDVQLEGKARRVAEKAGVTRWALSITHRGAYAAAIAAAIGAPQTESPA